MKNCGGDAEKLRSQLRNIVEHYKVKFNNLMFNFNIQLLGDYTCDADLVTFANHACIPFPFERAFGFNIFFCNNFK